MKHDTLYWQLHTTNLFVGRVLYTWFMSKLQASYSPSSIKAHRIIDL